VGDQLRLCLDSTEVAVNEAVHYIIGDALNVMAGALLSLYIIVAILELLLSGLPPDRWPFFYRRGK
jgi:hypothetical protein